MKRNWSLPEKLLAFACAVAFALIVGLEISPQKTYDTMQKVEDAAAQVGSSQALTDVREAINSFTTKTAREAQGTVFPKAVPATPTPKEATAEEEPVSQPQAEPTAVAASQEPPPEKTIAVTAKVENKKLPLMCVVGNYEKIGCMLVKARINNNWYDEGYEVEGALCGFSPKPYEWADAIWTTACDYKPLSKSPLLFWKNRPPKSKVPSAPTPTPQPEPEDSG